MLELDQSPCGLTLNLPDPVIKIVDIFRLESVTHLSILWEDSSLGGIQTCPSW